MDDFGHAMTHSILQEKEAGLALTLPLLSVFLRHSTNIE